MNAPPKAIETEYNGYRFRSRTEARWAVFLNSYSEPWEYEKEGYELPSGRYLPDFWLPRMDMWLEIKGIAPNEFELNACEDLSHHTNRPVAIAWGLPIEAIPFIHMGLWNSASLFFKSDRLIVFACDITDGGYLNNKWWEGVFLATEGKEHRLCICSNDDRKDRDFWTPDGTIQINSIKQIQDIWGPIEQQFIKTAKSARFEHGESGSSFDHIAHPSVAHADGQRHKSKLWAKGAVL